METTQDLTGSSAGTRYDIQKMDVSFGVIYLKIYLRAFLIVD